MELQVIQENCSRKDKIEMSRFVSLRACGGYSVKKESTSYSLHIDLVTSGTVFLATPINPVPVIPSALTKHLLGPLSLTGSDGEPKAG